MPLCLICPTGSQPLFAEISELSDHILKAHSKGRNSFEAQPPTQQLVASTQCIVCYKKCTTPGGLLSHQKAKQHYLPCPTCSRNFTATKELAQHHADAHSHLPSSFSTGVNSHSLEKGQRSAEQRVIRRCSECETCFDSLVELETHRVSHRKFPCSKCSQSFSSLIEWNGHFKQAHNKVQCSACNAVFTSEANLASHGRYCPTIARPASSQSLGSKTASGSQNKGPVVCDFCNKGFSSREALQAHAATKHPSAAKCVICHLLCSSPTELEDHVNTIHSCTVCGDGILRNSETLADHMVEHSHPIRCKKCGTRYRSEQERALHFAAADNEHPICTRCQVGFEDDTSLRTHANLAHPPSPKPSPKPSPRTIFKCEHCPGLFSLQVALEAHVAAKHKSVLECEICHHACSSQMDLDVHTVTVHSCLICHDGVYTDAKSLEVHLEQHRSPYRCISCGTAYAEEVHLLQHYKESPNDIHPLCDKCGIAFENSDAYTAHVEEAHPRFACETCDGALFGQDELPAHYLSSQKHPKCEKCHIGFKDQFDFADHGGSAHPESHCYFCQWQFDSPNVLRGHVRHFANHPQCVDCDLRFADTDAYQHHLFVSHRPSSGDPQDLESLTVSEDKHNQNKIHADLSSPPPSPPERAFDPQWGFEGSASLPYASFIPLPPSLSGYSSPTSQRLTTESAFQSGSSGSHSCSSTLSVEQGFPNDEQQREVTIQPPSLDLNQALGGSPEFNHSPLSMIPLVGTPLMSSTQTIPSPSLDFRSPFSPRPDTALLVPLSQAVHVVTVVNKIVDSDSSGSFTHSPKLVSPVVKLPDLAAASPSSTTSGWTTSGTDSKGSLQSHSTGLSKGMNGTYAVEHIVSPERCMPQLSLVVPSSTQPNAYASVSACPSSISPESAGINVSANVTPDYLREARAYLSLTHQPQGPSSPPASHSPGTSPILSSTGLALGERRREVRFEDNIMSEPVWDRQSTSSDSTLDPPVSFPRTGAGHFRRNGVSKLPRFSALKRGARKWTNGKANHAATHTYNRKQPDESSGPSYHCRSCYSDDCQEPTVTMCGHLFCYQYVRRQLAWHE
ncbi:hypothetical protein PAXRUDRAFT_832798 [Paxillus rubicundulus Ve08.2h10]|uniref:C2H2-type domain-containing protein n=1 Tax=Paxillus rubicundulus Ve08.2h10 TaxID=930991 RepID=A0A0D0D0K2_9AGAM|nr:hypothetical protein PAXRUDRAFT_832798 [Paxillus rubicundulus Ve08.2h10]